MDATRLPPQNIEAEQSVLGAVLLDKDVLDRVSDILKPEAFYSDHHRIIYSAMLSLYERNMPVDIVTLSEELQTRKSLEVVGGLSYLTVLSEIVPTSSNVEYYAKIVGDKYQLRRLISSTFQIMELAYRGEGEVGEILDRSQQSIFDISLRSSSQHFYSLPQVLDIAWKQLDEKQQKKGLSGIPTGFPRLNQLTCGFQDSDLIIIAGRTSMGKTAFALNIAQYAAIEEKVPVAFFSLEMSKEQLVLRMICTQAMVDQQGLRLGKLSEGEWQRINSACNVLSPAPIFIDEDSNITPLEIRSRVRRLKAEHKIGLVIIDYLQLMSTGKKIENRVQEISEITRSLKLLAKELKVPVIALSQLSREMEKRKDKGPLLSDLRESGSIEQDADLVIFVHRKGLYELQLKKDREEDISAEEEERLLSYTRIIVAKQRNGPTGEVDAYFRYQCAKFEEMEKYRQE